MDYVQGTIMNLIDDREYIEEIANIVDHLSTLRGDRSGSLSGGPCRGLLWPETEDLIFNSTHQMENWLNSMLLPGEGKLSLENYGLVLCHLDIAPRLIIWQNNGTLCLLDWASSGFYPRVFEFWALWNLEGKDGPFNKMLLECMKPLSESELGQKPYLTKAWYNMQKYTL